jgi:TolB-like protein/DNA-binding winged helix-turn-helix (wHTH) protein/Tfp pilus assembly protein PilF
MMKEDSARVYDFGPFRLDPAKRILWRSSEPVPLTGRAFDTLLVLLQNAGTTLEKEYIIETVWQGAAVEENNLTQCISTLRKKLGESRGDNRFIVTLSGKGYRFVAPVETLSATAAPRIQNSKPETSNGSTDDRAPGDTGNIATEPVPARDSPIPESVSTIQTDVFNCWESSPIQKQKLKPRFQIRLATIGAIGVAAVLVAISWRGEGGYRHFRVQRSYSSRLSSSPARRIMLAILPFENLTGDPGQEYFSDGFTEEVITRLGRLDPDHLGVIARASVMQYKHSGKNIRQIAGELGVDYVLEGSVRHSGDRIRTSVQLVKAADQTHLWAQSYEGTIRNVLGLQESVALHVEKELVNRLDRQFAGSATVSRSIDPEAYEAYLEALYFLSRRDITDLRKAAGELEKAVQKDPRYARAYAGLADCYALLLLDGEDRSVLAPKAQAAALKAMALDSSLAEAHTALAAVRVLYYWDWAGAEREFRRALELNANYVLAHHWYAVLDLGPQGRYSEAMAQMEFARQLDPVSPVIDTDLGWIYAISGSYDDAFAQYQKALHLNPRFVPAHFRLVEYYLTKKMYPRAVQEMILDEAYSGDLQVSHYIEQEYKAKGFSNFLGAEIEMAKSHPTQPAAALIQAQNYALLGRADEAMRALSTLYEKHDPSLIFLKVDPELASLRSDRRFQELERRCGLAP